MEPGRAHRWGLGAFLLVILVYVLSSLALVPLINDVPTKAWKLALAVSAPTLAAAGLALVTRRCAATVPEPTCGCTGRFESSCSA